MKFSWERAGRVVRAIVQNKAVITLIVANVLTILVSLGLVSFTATDIQTISVEVVGTVLVTVNAVALLIGSILEANREPKASD